MKRNILILLIFIGGILNAQNPLLIPATISGTSIDLTLQTGTHEFYSGISTPTMGANGNILGPTLLLNAGDFVDFSVTNNLTDMTTIHWHGLHVAPENDGGPHTIINPGETWTPSFTILDKAGVYWYHPHLHSKTNEHVSKGIAGMIIVSDAEEQALALPRAYGEDDFPLVIQTKDFDVLGQIVVPSNSDDVVMVNATVDAALAVPEQVVRFRVLNGSSMRVFNLGLDNGQTFYQISSDGGLLSAPVALTRMEIAPGERAELLIDFSGMTGQTVFLKSFASTLQNGIYGASSPGMNSSMVLNGYYPNALNGQDFNIMQFNVGVPTASPITEIPTVLATVTPIPEANSDFSRTLTMSPVTMGINALNGDFLINGATFNMNVVNQTIPLGNTEIWSIVNQSPISHPFHIHDVQFYILDINGVAPPANQQGRKDVILVKPQQTVRFICKFEDFANPDIPYMYHCHMLYHEDKGMMGQFVVVDQTSVEKKSLSSQLSIYPSPSKGKLYIKLDNNLKINKVEVINILGKLVYSDNNFNDKKSINLEKLQKGNYFVQFSTNKGEIIKRVTFE